MKQRKKSTIPLIWPTLLLLLAYGLRVYGLDAQNIWGDEAMSIIISDASVGDSLYMEANPPLYFLWLRVARGMWGSTPFALRYLSVLCGVIVVAIIGRIGREIHGNRLLTFSLLAAASSPFLIYYAQEARMYGPALIGGAGSVLMLLKLIKVRQRGMVPQPQLWAGYFALSMVAVFSHYYAFAVLFAEAAFVFIWAVVQRDKIIGRFLIVWVVMATCFLPYFFNHRQYWGNQTDRRFDDWTIEQFTALSSRTLVAFGSGITLSAEERWLGWLIVGLAALGVIWLLRSRPWHGVLLTGVVLVGLLFAWAITPLLPFFWERYLLASMPAFVVLIGAGLDGLARWQKMLTVPLAALVLLTTAPANLNYFTDPIYIKGGYGDAMALIGDQLKDDDILLLNGPLQAALFYYYQPANSTSAIIPRDSLLTEADANAYFETETSDFRRVWLVESGNQLEYDPNGVAQAWLAANGSFALHRDFPGVGVDLFVLAGADSAENSINATLSDAIHLNGYTLEATNLQPGDPLLLSLFWQTDTQLPHDYTVFTHVLAEDGALVAQADGQPAGGSRPTTSWQTSETIADSYAILLPPELAAGIYTVQIGMYLWPDLTRLPTFVDGAAQGDAVVLGQFTVGSEP